MPEEGWSERSLGEIVDMFSGGTPSKSRPEYWDGEIPWISGASLHVERLYDSDRRVTESAIGNGTRLAPKDATLVLVRGMSLLEEIRIGRATRSVAFNQDVKALVAKADVVDQGFLTYALLALRPVLLGMVHLAGHGTGVLATDRLAALTIPLPPQQEQQRIAGVLGSLDDLIEKNQRLARSCEALAIALTGRATGQVALRELAAELKGKTIAPVGTTDHYSLPAFDVDGLPERLEGSAIKSNKSQLSDPVVLVSRLNPHIPRVWMAYPERGILSAASTEFVTLVGSTASVEEVWAVCASPAYLDQMNGLVTGTTGSHQRVEKDALLTLAVPDVRTLTDAERRSVVALVQEANTSRAAARDLVRVRDELLPLLVSGRVSVREVAA